MMEKQKLQNKKNPGVANREARKAERGETFVGFRPARMEDAKAKSRSRQALKKETRKMVSDY